MDFRMEVTMWRVRQQIGCDKVDEKKYLGGMGCNIAVLDTGVAYHPDLNEKIMLFHDFVHHRQGIYDDSGHGTHVCGILCGSGRLSGGRYRGIAPESGVIVGKVLDREGKGDAETLIEGIKWVIEKSKAWNIRVLNVSIGVGEIKEEERKKALIDWLERVCEEGILVVCAAGHKGPEMDSLSPLGQSPRILSVGCHDGAFFKDKPGRCESYSGRGSLISSLRKPDLVAPGTDIISCNAGIRYGRGQYVEPYISKSGTSMATPIVAGALALYLSAHPEAEPESARKKLLYTATDLGEPWYKQGYGMINIEKMLE